MIRSTWTRLAALAASVAVVASCDTATTASSQTGAKGPTIAIDSPTAGALVNLGDSVFVSVHLHDDRSLRAMVISGVTQKGSIDLGTFSQKARYVTMSVPV